MSEAYKIFVNRKNAEKFAKEHNGKIIPFNLETDRRYEVKYEEEGERNEQTTD